MAESTAICAVNGCGSTDVYAGATDPVRCWRVDTHPPEYVTIGLLLCHAHAADLSWSI